MKKAKRIISVIITAALVAGVTSGCGKKNKGVYTEDGRMIISIANSVAISENSAVEKYLEEKYDVEINAYGYAASYYDKLGTMIASKDIPDVMFINDMSNWEPLYSQGALANIDMDTVKEAAPDHYAHIESVAPELWELGKKNGKLVAIPKTVEPEYSCLMIWNKTWMDKLGIKEIPKTLDECEIAFDKVVNGDPDGDGKKNTYAISAVGSSYYRQFDWVFGAYGVMPEQWTLIDGKLVNGTVTDSAKAALERIHSWYEKGYICPEFVTDTEPDISKRYWQGQIAVNIAKVKDVSIYHPTGKANLDSLNEAQRAQVIYGALPTGPDGDSGDWRWGPLGNFVVFGAQLNGDTEKQKKILQILNDLNYNEEVSIMGNFGVHGEHFEYYDESVGKSSGIARIGDYSTDANKRAEVGLGFFNLLKCGDWADSSITNIYSNKEYLDEAKSFPKSTYSDLLMRSSLPSTLSLGADTQKYKISSYVEFITGKRSLDEWDEFVKEYMDMGGSQLQKEAQEFYDSVFAK